MKINIDYIKNRHPELYDLGLNEFYPYGNMIKNDLSPLITDIMDKYDKCSECIDIDYLDYRFILYGEKHDEEINIIEHGNLQLPK